MADEGTFCSKTEVERKAGTEAASTPSGENYTNQFIKETEGWIMATTKKENLIEKYEDLSDPVKELLRLITSNLAAIDVINYDYDNFDSRIDAENRTQILWTKAMKGIKDLKEILIQI